MTERLQHIIDGLNIAETESLKLRGCDLLIGTNPYTWRWRDRKKYIAIDCGGSGAFLVEKETGELYNIKAYGVPDKNKKAKADIGNIYTVDPFELHRRRWNYLR